MMAPRGPIINSRITNRSPVGDGVVSKGRQMLGPLGAVSKHWENPRGAPRGAQDCSRRAPGGPREGKTVNNKLCTFMLVWAPSWSPSGALWGLSGALLGLSVAGGRSKASREPRGFSRRAPPANLPPFGGESGSPVRASAPHSPPTGGRLAGWGTEAAHSNPPGEPQRL